MEIIRYTSRDMALYQETLELRDEILRQPWGFSIYDENLSYETENQFFGAVENGKLIGSLNYFVKAPKTAQLCAFVIKKDRQKAGIGTALVKALFQELQESDFEKCTVSARPPADSFYEKVGFVKTGEKRMNPVDGISFVMIRRVKND